VIADSDRSAAVLLKEKLDEALAQIARREREHEALLETAQKALAHVERERDELRLACDGCADSEHKTGRAHYDDCPVGVAVRERDEARRDFVRVADALGCVSTDDTGRAGALASVEEVVEQARKAQKCFDLWEDVHAASFMACENPPTGCDCAGCSYAREKGGDA
jgi:hypothetical protein